MEYGPESNIFVIKMMMKSGLEKNIFKFLHAQSLFLENIFLLHFVAFSHVASLFSTGVDNEKALELTNSTVFHRDRQ